VLVDVLVLVLVDVLDGEVGPLSLTLSPLRGARGPEASVRN
jgi:hypothetical protein